MLRLHLELQYIAYLECRLMNIGYFVSVRYSSSFRAHITTRKAAYEAN